MVILFMGSLIYCAFLFTLMWVAASLVKDWQAAIREKPAGDMPMTAMTAQSTQAAIWQSANPAMRGGMVMPTGDAYARTDPMMIGD